MYNRSIFIGRFVAKPEIKTTPNGKNVCSFRLAVNRPYKDEEGGIKVDFIPFVAWGKDAENIAAYFDKGRLIGIEGSMQSRDYTDKDGIKRYVVECSVERWFFVEGKKSDSAGG